MANAGTVQLFNTDPNVQAQAAILQQRLAMAQALQSEGMKPLDTSGRQIGGVAYAVSPFEGLAKMAQAISGQKLMQDTTSQQAGLASQAYGSLLDRYAPGQSPSYSGDQVSDASSQALGQGAQGGSVGPTNANAVRMGQMLAGQQPANAGTVNPRNPSGMPAALLADYTAGWMPKEAFDVLASPYQATDLTKMATQGRTSVAAANQGGVAKANTDPKILALQQAGVSPQVIQQIVQGQGLKDATILAKPDQSQYMPTPGGPQLTAVAPNPGDNLQFSVGPNNSVSAGPVPGAPTARAGMAGATSYATARGGAQGGYQQVTLPDGSVRPVYGSDVPPAPWSATPPPKGQPGMAAAVSGPMGATLAQVDKEIAQTQQGLNTVKDPASRAMLQQHLADMQDQRQKMVASQPPVIGQSTAGRITQESGAKLVADLPQQVTQTKQSVAGLENALSVLQQVKKSGPGVGKAVNILAYMGNAGIPIEQGDVNGYQSLKKYLANASNSAAAAAGFNTSDNKLDSFFAGNPNADTMNPTALEGAIRYVLSQHDAALARAQFIQQQVQANPGDANAPQRANQEWSSNVYNPRLFEFSRMTPQDQQAAVTKMSKDGTLKTFQQQYNAAHQRGWVQ